MKKEYKDILTDLKVLEKSCEEDFNKKEYSAYEHYIREYNSILDKLQKFGLFNDINKIVDVPDGEKAYMGVGSQAEISKQREVINETKKLIEKISGNKGSGRYFASEGKEYQINKTLFWTIITVLLTIVGFSYKFGFDNGNRKFDEKKIELSETNNNLKSKVDSLSRICENYELKIDSLINQNQNISNAIAKNEREKELFDMIDDCIGKYKYVDYQLDLKKFTNWKEEVYIVLKKVDEYDNKINSTDYFSDKIKQCEDEMIGFESDVYKCAIIYLENIKLKMK